MPSASLLPNPRKPLGLTRITFWDFIDTDSEFEHHTEIVSPRFCSCPQGREYSDCARGSTNRYICDWSIYFCLLSSVRLLQVQRVSRILWPEVKRRPIDGNTHLCTVPKVKKEWSYTSKWGPFALLTPDELCWFLGLHECLVSELFLLLGFPERTQLYWKCICCSP
jgi:hypothetical protein